MMGLMTHEREEFERLQVCVVEQATEIARLEEANHEIKQAARDAMSLVKIAKRAAAAWANTDGYHQAADIINLLCVAIEKMSGWKGEEI